MESTLEPSVIEQTQELLKRIIENSRASKVVISKIKAGRNPRTYFDERAHVEMMESMRAVGVLQPILIRPIPGTDDEYELIAGERRWRGASAVFGADFEMPVLIVEMTDEMADKAALIENIKRENMSPTEEAVAAAKIVGDNNGNREAAAKQLGWSRSTLDSRLALMNCSDLVKQALNERKILLGHAELLAALSKTMQDAVLPIVLKGETVADLKKKIEQVSLKLSAAIFDQTECQTCPHNSTIQSSMFSDAIADGNCTNGSCFNKKTESKLGEIAEGLKEDYPVIRIIRAGDNATLIKLEADGKKGVGAEQAEACKGCADYGAGVSALPQALGQVFKGFCFNTSCHANHVAARIMAETKAVKATTTLDKPKSSDDKSPEATKETVAKATPAPVTKVNESDRIKAYRESVWRKALQKEVSASPEQSSLYLLALCINGDGRHIDKIALTKVATRFNMDIKSSNLGGTAKQLESTTPENRATLTTLLAVSAIENLEVSQLESLARHHQLDLRKHWALDKAFLDLLTKSEIQVVAKQIGLDKVIVERFNKMFNEKKDQLIEEILSVKDFDYSATIPQAIAIPKK